MNGGSIDRVVQHFIFAITNLTGRGYFVLIYLLNSALLNIIASYQGNLSSKRLSKYCII